MSVKYYFQRLPNYTEYIRLTKEGMTFPVILTSPLPSYSEYILKNPSYLSNKTISTIEKANEINTTGMLQDPIVQFPSIPLCKDSADKSLYDNIYCYLLLALYFLIIFTIISWQIRWLYNWREQQIQRNGLRSNQYHTEIELGDKKVLSGMSSKRCTPGEK